jgi:hypothetical protein
MSEIETASTTIWPPIRLKKDAAGAVSFHRLDGILTRVLQFIIHIPQFFFPGFEYVGACCQHEMNARCHAEAPLSIQV